MKIKPEFIEFVLDVKEASKWIPKDFQRENELPGDAVMRMCEEKRMNLKQLLTYLKSN